jgi:hypothetical protein
MDRDLLYVISVYIISLNTLKINVLFVLFVKGKRKHYRDQETRPVLHKSANQRA